MNRKKKKKVYDFILKTNFNNNIANTDNFKFLKYKAKLLENKLSLLQMMQMEF